MTSTLPPLAISLIEDFASVKLTTKEYKSMKNAHKCRITKVKYKCVICDKLLNKRQLDKQDYHYNSCNNVCLDWDNTKIDKWWDLVDSAKFTNKYENYYPYGEKSRLTRKWRKVMNELESKYCYCCKARKCVCSDWFCN